MIFDSEAMVELREKYKDESNVLVPNIILYDRHQDFISERNQLETLITRIPEEKRKNLLTRLINEDDSQFLGAWFELRLYGWLSEIGATEYEPIIEGDLPDFLISIGDQDIAVEAKTVQLSEGKINEQKIETKLFSALKSIEKPFLIIILDHSIKTLQLRSMLFSGQLLIGWIVILVKNSNINLMMVQ